MNKIMVVDDDTNIRELIRLILKKEGFEVLEASDGVDALEKMERNKVDLIVLDIMMPNMDGWEFCGEVRDFYDMPILMLTAKGETSQKLKGFKLGADDYLTKPFEPEELVARVKALLKRCNIALSKIIDIGKIKIDQNQYMVKTETEEMTLPLKEFELLFMLAGALGKTFSRERLIEDIWGFDFDGNERTLDVHIGRLREKFPQEIYGFKITTIRGVGYRLEILK
ncbi:response regulator transcription factor [Clostridium aminobutyricum]|uniref:Heme response regulator HssR n=1 Tax=Clostridium aminobutyricum TaxID=33953 RepID=A0A939IJF2_CLOAM|nr:response regulator transcription factor [Clostridium aminobutyricum]MBN7773548.1 response regulator transcription factor [Clostridium aminobutyricum]